MGSEGWSVGVLRIRELEQFIMMNIYQFLIMLSIFRLASGQRRQFLKDVIEKIKNSPRHRSISPSYNGERQFDVIGTGRLPLENHSYQPKTAEFFPESRHVDHTPARSPPVTSFLGRIFNRLKRKPSFFPSLVSVNKKKKPTKRPINQSISIKLKGSHFSPPDHTDHGFVPYFPGSTNFNKDDIVTLLDKSMKLTDRNPTFTSRNYAFEDEVTSNKNKHMSDDNKSVLNHELDVDKPYKPSHGDYNFNEAKDHVFAFESDGSIQETENNYDELQNQNNFISSSYDSEQDLGKETNPFKSENLALNFVVNNPKEYDLFQGDKENYSAFNSKNIFENNSDEFIEDFDTNNNFNATEYDYDYGNILTEQNDGKEKVIGNNFFEYSTKNQNEKEITSLADYPADKFNLHHNTNENIFGN